MSRITVFRTLRPSSCLAKPRTTIFHVRHQSTTSDLTHLATSLPQRRLPIIYDYLSPTHSHLLNISLSDILPRTATSAANTATASNPPIPPNAATEHPPLPPTQHLIYFQPTTPGPLLLPDGTDPLQSPGPPFVRRMWAGGALHWNNAIEPALPLNNSRAACVERLSDVSIKGKPGQEKVFVGIERRIGRVGDTETEDAIRARFTNDGAASEADFAGAELIERRNIVFMRERSREQAMKDAEVARTRQLKPPQGVLAFDHTVTPDARLLFRYSALTYNAHAIHLDPGYCRDVEGHRGLLVHGPLSFTLIVTALRCALRQRSSAAGLGQREERVKTVEYRALSPLYAGEPVRLCGVDRGEGKWEVWAETPEGGVAVKATVRTEVGGMVQYPDLEIMGF